MTITKWTDDVFRQQLIAASNVFCGMPSSSQLRESGHGALASEISRRGGFIKVAADLGLQRKQSDSDTGWDGEKMFVSLCDAVGIPAVRMEGVKAPFDVLVNDCVRVDVKSANRKSYGPGSSHGWYYRIGKLPQADLIVLMQLDTKDFYSIPWSICTTSNMTIAGDGGMYAKYKNNWSLIRRLIELRKTENQVMQEAVA